MSTSTTGDIPAAIPVLITTTMRKSHNISSAPPPEKNTASISSLAVRGVTGRAVLIGTLLTPINAFWVLRMEEVMYGPYPSLLSLFANTIFILFLLMGLNALMRRYTPKNAFHQGEMLTIYTMLTISTGMAGQSGLNIAIGMIGHGAWFGTPEKGWDAFSGAFPDWLVIRDRAILRGHYLGSSSFYRPEVMRAWLIPILAWTVLFCLILLVAYCVNVLVRRQWADHERLTFPITWLPLQMTEGGSGSAFFRNRLMWAGFVLAAGLNLYNGLAFLYPVMRPLPLGIIDLNPLFTVKPWSAIGWFPVTLYPIAIGLGYLLPLDLLFSCWFFYFFWKAQMVVSSAMAWDSRPDFPFIREQGFGAVVGLFCYYLWSGRKHYAVILRSAVSRVNATPKTEGTTSSMEALSDRAALLGIAIGLIGLMLFAFAMKVALWVAITFFALYLAFLTVVTRIRAELGAPIHDFSFMGPDNILTRVLGASRFRQNDLAFLSLSYPLTYSRSNDTMPIALESMQMAKQGQIQSRRMFAVILYTTFFGALCTFWAYEHQAYQLGAAARWNAGTHFAQESYQRMASWNAGMLDAHPNTGGTLAVGAGLLLTLVLMAFRQSLPGFPFHPIGFAVSSAWAINIVWLPLFIAWVCKGLTMRYGGLRIYRLLLPFFLGLVLGDCVMGSVWGLLSLALNMRTYNFFGA